MLKTKRFIAIFTFIFLLGGAQIFAQSSAFVYQGKLSDAGASANGSYEFEFKLFDAVSGGNQIGQTLSGVPATVSNGIFSVNLDFGVTSYTGAPRFLDIAVRAAGSGQAYTNLNPRQAVTSTPYAVRSLNANQAESADIALVANFASNSANLGGIAANQYVLTNDPRLNQAPGNYIQNTQVQQASSNFNISGEGKADKFSAATQFNIGATRVLAAGNGSVYAGFGAGQSNPTGGLNTFLGNNAGMTTTSGTRNTFVGSGAGIQNVSGNDNTFVGSGAGLSNQTAANNSFFGVNSGKTNKTGANNAFFGFESGFLNLGGAENSIFGAGAGKSNDDGSKNSFFGRNAGAANTDGGNNSFFGYVAGQNNTTGVGNSFFGDSSGLLNNGSNNSFFGKAAGLVSTTGDNNTFLGYSAGINNTSGGNNTLIGANAQVGSGSLNFATAIGAGAIVNNDNQIVIGRNQGQDSMFIWGKTIAWGGLTLGTMVPGANNALCGGGGSGTEIGFCSSSIRYKENVENYTRGLDLVLKLRPVTFNWKVNGERDLGFIAEEVGEVEPLLNVVFNRRIEGVKYAQVTTALVNAVKEQQEQIRRQQAEIEALKALVCASAPSAAVCQPKQ